MLLTIALLAAVAEGGIIPHSQFIFDGEKGGAGLIKLKSDEKLRLNVKGGEPKEGDPVILWNCGPQNHELFKIEAGHIELAGHPGRCLNAEAGAAAGHRIITWPCSKEDNDQFIHGKDGRIRLKSKKDMCINIKGGGVEHGAELILWPCADKPLPNEVFTFNDGLIQVKANPEFNFNVAGGNVTEAGHLVLWTCNGAGHEVFQFTKAGELQLQAHPHLCLNAEGGLAPGHRVVAWPCSGKTNPNELWKYDSKKNMISSKELPSIGFNVKGGAMEAGAEIVLWPLEEKQEL